MLKITLRQASLLLVVALAGCAGGSPTAPDAPSMVRICDATGCSERARSSASFNPSADDDPEQERRIAALEQLAARDPRAAYDLSLRYFRGDGVPQNTYQSLRWMRKAAEAGQVVSQLALGRFYLMGVEEMGSDPAEAEKWLLMAAAQGNKEASALAKEASAAKLKNQEEYRLWVSYRRSAWYGYWGYGYPYYGSWGPRGWYFR
ncbi:tetratricopeptide repeat protein [Variovorax robiniae]|uniref:Tetratricopeptide repeat protein n=1 Tax=Variovorax robiniae TaxID=1836199 RepID=A0ABU8XDE5_9BURK